MSWITYDYLCEACGVRKDELVDRAAIPDVLQCDECGGNRVRCVGAHVMNIALPDGNRRFQGLREQAKLRKEERLATRTMNYSELKRISAERRAMKGKV